jgi:capsular exopolysaccharide synthesis family protein
VRLRERAEPPNLPIPTRTPLYATLAGLLAFVFPFGIGALLEMRQPKVYTASQLRAISPLPIIEEVPKMKRPVQNPEGKSSVSFEEELFREKIGSLSTQLLLSDPLRESRSFLITSSGPEAGKTTMSLAIASELARMLGEKVLLIDGCMEKGGIHQWLNLEESPGLGEVLAFQKDINDVIQPVPDIPNLHVLPAGSIEASPYSLLGDGRFSELIKEMTGHFARVLVDAPPVLSDGETLLMSSSVDAVLLSVMSCRTIAKELPLTLSKLKRADSRLYGVLYIGSAMESSPSERAVRS